VQRGRIDEGFEAGKLDRGQAHASVVRPLRRGGEAMRRSNENIDAKPLPNH
jgi:hypothetical protein